MSNLTLIGFMGTGKSTVGRICARRLNKRFVDTDSLIVQRVGATIPEIFHSQGESEFRRMERIVVDDLSHQSDLVISTGGGTALDPGNAALLRSCGLVILLTASPEMILRRVGRSQNRPLLANCSDPLARIRALLLEREPKYRHAAHFRVDTGKIHADAAANEVLMLFQLITGEGEPNETP